LIIFNEIEQCSEKRFRGGKEILQEREGADA